MGRNHRRKSAFRLVAEPILVAVVLAFLVRASMRIYLIPSSSMTPTLSAGDHIVVTPYHGGFPERGDVVVFRSPVAGTELSVKRVIAVPGDLIDTEEGRVRIGGRALEESYLATSGGSGPIPPQVVPAGFVFVMGDNRGDSFDSRHWGLLSKQLVAGRARFVLWSSGVRRVRIFKWID